MFKESVDYLTNDLLYLEGHLGKQLAMQFHPDRAEQKDNQTLTLYTKKFQNILQAYEILLYRVS